MPGTPPPTSTESTIRQVTSFDYWQSVHCRIKAEVSQPHYMSAHHWAGSVTEILLIWVGVSDARSSGESLTGVDGRLFKIHSTSTMKVCRESSSRIRSCNKNRRIFFADFTRTSQAPPLEGDRGLKFHCNPLWHRESWIFCWFQRMIPFQFTFSEDEVGAAVAVDFFHWTAAMDESEECF